MTSLSAFAPAKINLTLHVTGLRADGYHLLDSLVVFADVGDQIHVRPAPNVTLQVHGPRAQGVPTDDSNLVLRAARLFDSGHGASIMLDKHLPAAAGIGGGSSDAAATLLALSRLWAQPVPDQALSLGADIPVCLKGCTTRMAGIGEALFDVPALPPLPAILVNPGVDLPTPSVFKALTCRANPPMSELPETWGSVAETAGWLARQRNDLEPPAIGQAPVIAKALDALNEALLARMSGSGATCFGLFETTDAARRVAKDIRARHPDWWVQETVLAGDHAQAERVS